MMGLEQVPQRLFAVEKSKLNFLGSTQHRHHYCMSAAYVLCLRHPAIIMRCPLHCDLLRQEHDERLRTLGTQGGNTHTGSAMGADPQAAESAQHAPEVLT